MENLAIIDLVFLGIIGLFTIVAAIKGFVKAIFGKLCWIVGLILAFFLYGIVVPIMENYISNTTLATIVAFIAVFIVAFLIIKIIEVIISKIFSGQILKSLDKLLGAIFGFIEGSAIVFVIVFVITQQPWFDVSELVNDSFIVNFLQPFVQGTQEMISKEVSNV